MAAMLTLPRGSRCVTTWPALVNCRAFGVALAKTDTAWQTVTHCCQEAWVMLRCHLVAGFVFGSLTLTLAHAASLKTEEFSGYWTGAGEVTMGNGAIETLRCVATYRSTAQAIRQQLRCASPAYAISSTADLAIAGEAIKGTWEEKTYASNGEITGRVTDGGLSLSIRGPTFSAEMLVAHTACKQAIDITPVGVDVSKIRMTLGKC
jgi:hypothetical protein